jgi:hypothetical protein
MAEDVAMAANIIAAANLPAAPFPLLLIDGIVNLQDCLAPIPSAGGHPNRKPFGISCLRDNSGK